MVRSIKTGQGQLYNSITESEEYPFKHNYELFSFGAVIGFLLEERYEHDKKYSQEYIHLHSIKNDKHRNAIEYIAELAEAELVNENGEFESEDDLINHGWLRTIEYADGGLLYLDEEFDLQGGLDFTRFYEMSLEKWDERIEEIFGQPTSDSEITEDLDIDKN